MEGCNNLGKSKSEVFVCGHHVEARHGKAHTCIEPHMHMWEVTKPYVLNMMARGILEWGVMWRVL